MYKLPFPLLAQPTPPTPRKAEQSGTDLLLALCFALPAPILSPPLEGKGLESVPGVTLLLVGGGGDFFCFLALLLSGGVAAAALCCLGVLDIPDKSRRPVTVSLTLVNLGIVDVEQIPRRASVRRCVCGSHCSGGPRASMVVGISAEMPDVRGACVEEGGHCVVSIAEVILTDAKKKKKETKNFGENSGDTELLLYSCGDDLR